MSVLIWQCQSLVDVCKIENLSTPCRRHSAMFFFKFYFIFKLYKIVLVLPNIKMNLPQVYMCPPSWTLLPPPSPYHPSGSSQCTSPKHPVSYIEPGLRCLNPSFLWVISVCLVALLPILLYLISVDLIILTTSNTLPHFLLLFWRTP